MTQTAPIQDDLGPEEAAALPRTAEVAAYLAAKMCHDFISPASAIVSGLDLLEDPTAQDMRDDAMSLITDSGRKLADLLAFTRIAFGASASAQTFDPRELEKLAQGIFSHMRADLDWQVAAPTLTKTAARTVLNLAQLAGAVLPRGGTVSVRVIDTDQATEISVEAAGTNARLRPEVQAGLRGEPMKEGLHGHWVQAYYVQLVLQDAGGSTLAEVGEEKVSFTANMPL
jgi:histidine phosphotransferase ChpT